MASWEFAFLGTSKLQRVPLISAAARIIAQFGLVQFYGSHIIYMMAQHFVYILFLFIVCSAGWWADNTLAALVQS